MDSVQTSEVTINANTAFVDESAPVAVTVESARGVAKLSSKGQMTDISESTWNLFQMLTKPIKINTVKWTTSQAPGTFIAIVGTNLHPNTPKDLLNANVESMQTNLLKSYTFGRYSPVFTLQLNSTKFNNGRLWFGYVPCTEYADSFFETDNMTQMSMYPHVEIDAANASPVTLTMPWFHPQSSFNHNIDTIGERSLGYPFLYVFSQLAVPSGATTSLDVTIMMHLDATELHVPVNPVFTYLSPKVPTRQLLYLQRKLFPESDFESDNEAHGIFDRIGSLWNNLVGIAENIGDGIDHAVNLDFSEAAGDFGKAIDKGISTVEENEDVIAMLMDKPNCLKTEVMVPRQMGSLAYGIGSDTTTRLDITPYSHYRPNKFHFSGFHNDSDLLSLCRRYAVCNRVSWASTAVAGTELLSKKVHPIQPFDQTNVNGYQNSFLAHVARAFLRWRGSIKFRVSIIATQFHSGRLLLVYSNGYEGATTMDESMNWPCAVLDLHNADNRSYEFECKYNATVPFLRTNFHTNPVDLEEFSLYFLGEFKIYVLNELTHTESIATAIDIQVEVCAGDDFVVETPKNPSLMIFKAVVIKDRLSAGYVIPPWRGLKVESSDPTYFEEDNEAQALHGIDEVIHMLGELDTVCNLERDHMRLCAARIQSIKHRVNEMAAELGPLTEPGSRLTRVSNLMTNLDSLRSKIEVSFQNMSGFISIAEQLLANIPDNEAHALEDPTSSSETNVDLQHGEAIATFPLSHTVGALTNDVRDIVRRYGLWLELTVLPNLDLRKTTVFLPVSPLALASPSTNLLAWFSLMYRGWSGSLRYKILFKNSQIDTHYINVTHLPDLYTPTDNWVDSAVNIYPAGYACKPINTTDSHCLEFEVPYKSLFHFLYTRTIYEASRFNRYGYNGSIAIHFDDFWKRFSPDRRTALQMEIFIAAGDDFNFHFPVPPPPGSWANIYDEKVPLVEYTTAATTTTSTSTTTFSMASPSRNHARTMSTSVINSPVSSPKVDSPSTKPSALSRMFK